MTTPTNPPAEPESEAELDRELVAFLTEVQPLHMGFRIRERHLPADTTLAGFGIQVVEAANAMLLVIRDARFTAGAYPLARLAFEAGVEALYLATEPSYDEAGARARVFEGLEAADIRSGLHTAFDITDFGTFREEYAAFAAQIEREATALEHARAPEAASSLRLARAHFQPLFEAAHSGKRHPGHWTGTSRRAISQALSTRLEQPDAAQRLVATYSSLSRSSHPRFHPERWHRSSSPSGPLLDNRPERFHLPLRFTALAVSLLKEAYERVARTYI